MMNQSPFRIRHYIILFFQSLDFTMYFIFKNNKIPGIYESRKELAAVDVSGSCLLGFPVPPLCSGHDKDRKVLP